MPTALCGFDDGPAGLGRDLLAFRGPTILVDIGFDPDYLQDQQRPPNLAAKVIHALVDSGASECCIDSGLAMQLNLPIVDQRVIAGVGGQHSVNMHLAQVHVPSLQITMHGQFAAVNLAAGGQAHFALMGRSFLRHFAMIYDGRSGTVAISNDIPRPVSADPEEAVVKDVK